MLTPVEPPRVRIVVRSCQPASSAGRWLVTWGVHNLEPDALRLEEAWVPHGRFRGVGHVPLEVRVPPGESAEVSLEATATEPPGAVVENAFLILRATLRETPVRLFARMRVTFGAQGQAQPAVEALTAQFVQSG